MARVITMKRLIIALSIEEHRQLLEIAAAETREDCQQASHFVRQALASYLVGELELVEETR